MLRFRLFACLTWVSLTFKKVNCLSSHISKVLLTCMAVCLHRNREFSAGKNIPIPNSPSTTPIQKLLRNGEHLSGCLGFQLQWFLDYSHSQESLHGDFGWFSKGWFTEFVREMTLTINVKGAFVCVCGGAFSVPT